MGDLRMSIDPIAIPIVAIIAGASSAIGIPIARAFARRMEREDTRPAALPTDVTLRLERMEQALDSIAIEVERISEGQRFTTKLLAERNNSGASGVPESHA
jgi:NAD(P)-dependent dehydrogenase (short-subunit alcohol dehydrogenase family)